MYRSLITVMLIFLISAQACAPMKVETTAQPGQENFVELEKGPSVIFPAGALENQSTVEIAWDKNFTASEGEFKILGTPFVFEVPENREFSKVVTLTIPYEESKLAPGTNEANLFATYELDGKWYRYPSNVDTTNNLIIVETDHNGTWSYGFDKVVDVNTDFQQVFSNYIGNLENQAQIIEQARTEVEKREQEAYYAWNRMQLSAQKYRDDMGPTYQKILNEAEGFIVITVADKAAMGLVGQSGLITSTTLGTILVWGSNIISGAILGVYLGTLMGDTVLEIRAVYLWIDAQTRLNEARAVLEALENPLRTDFYPGNYELITDWMDLQKEINPDGKNPIDWSITTIPIEPDLNVEFLSDTTDLIKGDCANIQWNVSGGYSRYVVIGGKQYELSGSLQACPEKTSSFDLLIYGKNDELITAPQSITLTVEDDPVKAMCRKLKLTDEECMNAGEHAYKITYCTDNGMVVTCIPRSTPYYTFDFFDGGVSVSRALGNLRSFKLNRTGSNQFSNNSIRITFKSYGFQIKESWYVIDYTFDD